MSNPLLFFINKVYYDIYLLTCRTEPRNTPASLASCYSAEVH